MFFPIEKLQAEEFPKRLLEIPQPPKQLNYRGTLPSSELKLLSVVGSRKYTSYGKQVIDELISGLSSYGVGVVSGLALGIDSLSHEAALRNNLYTLAIPGGGLDDQAIYPASHKPLAHRILEAGGGMLSEYEPDFKATKWSFPQRNRLVTGISHATLLIEAAEKSGTLITARLAADYNRELLVVPGSIFSKNSAGVHQFLKLGATPVTSADDILEVLGIDKEEKTEKATTASTEEQLIINLLSEPLHRDELIRKMNVPVAEASQTLMLMELSGLIVSEQHIYRVRI
tara:strand:- start:5915 stop:6772 length:858 start_codon:yes stop_codon:yes gene_type:complete